MATGVEKCPQVSGMHLSESAKELGIGMLIECDRPAKHTGPHRSSENKMYWTGLAEERELMYAEELRKEAG